MEYDESDFLMLSGIQHFTFCRRRWALIHIENQWAENVRTIDGELMHELFRRGHTPKVKPAKACNACSMKELCLPELMRAGPASSYLREHMEEV